MFMKRTLRLKIILVCERKIDFLLCKYKVWTKFELKHCTNSAEVIMDSDVYFVGLGVNK